MFMENELFCNSENPNLFRYFRLGENWHDCFVVEFMLDKDCYDNLYWGNYNYVERDRSVISKMLTIKYLPDPRDEWKIENLNKFQSRIEKILTLSENKINQQINGYETD